MPGGSHDYDPKTSAIRALLFHLAEDAFDVLNWARREGLKRDQQLQQVVETFEKTLAESKARVDVATV